ncbi:MAG TPA: TIGR03564 family F420-dependent LLM class oxidoreductase [Acidimicrobiales bacterium]
MRYGVTITTDAPVDDVVDEIRRAREAGFASVALSQIFGYDALTMLAVAGREVPDVELMTAVVPTYPRHPLVLAAQALTVQAATGGRLVLGIGLSHQVVIEGVFGYSFDRPARHMREYLRALLPMLRGEQVSYQGDTVSVSTFGPLDVRAPAPPVLLAALAPQMLRLAGTEADGTATWMVGPATLADHVVPSITAAAAEAGRPAPRVSVSLPVSVSEDVDAAREAAARTFAIYGQLPSYRAMLDREGATGPADVAIVGDEDAVAAQIAAVADAGATEFVAAPYGSAAELERTWSLLSRLAKAG